MLLAIKTELKRAQDQYRLPGWFLGVVLGLPFALLITLVALTLPPFERAVPWVWGENQSLESIQFIVFFAATVQGLVLAWQMAVQGEAWCVWGFYLPFAGGLFFITMEEIAWGEQVSYTMNKQTETVELLIALAGLLYLVFNTRAFRYSAARPARIVGVRVLEREVLLSLADGREVGVEAGWLEGARENEKIVSRVPTGEQGKTEESGASAVRESVQPEPQVPVEVAPGAFGRPEEKADWRIAADGQSVVFEKLGREIHLAPLLAPQVAREDPDDLISFGWWRGLLWAALAAGLVSLIWLWLIPGDPKNAWVLGLSRTRVGMLVVGLGFVLGVGVLLGWKFREPMRYRGLAGWLNQRFQQPWWMAGGVVLGISGAVGGMIFLLLAYTQQDPFLRELFARLAPWAFLARFLFLEGLVALVLNGPRFQRQFLPHAGIGSG